MPRYAARHKEGKDIIYKGEKACSGKNKQLLSGLPVWSATVWICTPNCENDLIPWFEFHSLCDVWSISA